MIRIDFGEVKLFHGCAAGLAEKTALISISLAVGKSIDGSWFDSLGKKIMALCPHEPLWGLGEGDELQSLLMGDSTSAGDSEKWMAILVVALQRWAREPVWRGRVLSSSQGHALLAIPYHRPAVLKEALQFAASCLMLWSQPSEDETRQARLDHALATWLKKVQPGGLIPNALRFFAAAKNRAHPVRVEQNMLRLGWGARQQWLDSTFTGRTPNIAARVARDKFLASRRLRGAGLPVPQSEMADTVEKGLEIAAKLGWPVVVKPVNQDQGIGVTPMISDEVTFREAFDKALKYSSRAVLVEKHIQGDDHRLLVVGGKLFAATRRIPAGVVGNGKDGISALIASVNADPRRGTDIRSMLKKLELDAEAKTCLAQQGLNEESILADGAFARLRNTANISTGGTAVDVTAHIHPDNALLAVRASRALGLDIAGVDFLTRDIRASWLDVGGAICEINAQPGFRVHWLAQPDRDLNGEVIDWMFDGQPSRIPTAAITGTNGKTTTAQMLHRIWLASGKKSGVATTAGTWIGEQLIHRDNLSGYPGASIVLGDPTVEAAVLEMPRKGLLIFGHPCDRYDVAALLNVQDDHIGVDGVHSLQEMAALKAQVLERAQHAVVINAEDPLCMAVRDRAGTKRHILVARDGSHPALIEHRSGGGETVYIDYGARAPAIVIAQGSDMQPVMPVDEIPAVMNGALPFNASNALFATALAWAHGIKPQSIRDGLGQFTNSVEHNPGRYNLIEGFPYQVLVDFGHNPDGLRGVMDYVQRLPQGGRKILMNMMVGNRFARHLDDLAQVTASVFDRFVLSCRKEVVTVCDDWRGDNPVQKMLTHGKDKLQLQGVAENRIHLQEDPAAAIRHALSIAREGDFVVILAKPWLALPILEKMKPR